jgi:hypothetical protein
LPVLISISESLNYAEELTRNVFTSSSKYYFSHDSEKKFMSPIGTDYHFNDSGQRELAIKEE